VTEKRLDLKGMFDSYCDPQVSPDLPKDVILGRISSCQADTLIHVVKRALGRKVFGDDKVGQKGYNYSEAGNQNCGAEGAAAMSRDAKPRLT
jgi:hypothetical protein